MRPFNRSLTTRLAPVILIFLLLIGYSSARQAHQSSTGPIYFGYSGASRIQGIETSKVETAPNVTAPNEGYSITWSDAGKSTFGGLNVSGVASGIQARIKISGDIKVRNSGESFVETGAFAHHSYISFVMPKSVEWADVRFQAVGTSSASSTAQGDSASSSAGIGNAFYSKDQAKSEAHHDDALDDSATRPINIDWTYRIKFPGSRMIPQDRPEILSSGTTHIFRRLPQAESNGLYLVLDSFLNASATGENSGAGASIDLEITITVRPANHEELRLIEATTADSSSVSVNYHSDASLEGQSLKFCAYRSDSPQNITGAALIGEQSFTCEAGDHEVTFAKGCDLRPDWHKPYVIVTASGPGGLLGSTYFRKWQLATIAHGYAGNPMEPGAQSGTKQWVGELASNLKTLRHFDEVIPKYWIEDSVLEIAGRTEKHGKILAGLIAGYVLSRQQVHPGDVVDVMLIGHSRGTVVTSQALLNLRDEKLKGCWLYVTLLDPHPANMASNGLSSYAKTNSGIGLHLFTNRAENKMQDQEIAIPNLVAIKGFVVMSQRTEAILLKGIESRQNLHGILEGDNRITYPDSMRHKWITLTNLKLPGGARIGHDEVVRYFINLSKSGEIWR